VIVRPASDRSLLVTFGDEISLEHWRSVQRLARSLEGVRGILNLHPAYASVLIDFDPRLRTHEEIEALIHTQPADGPPPVTRDVEIPVIFDGPDLSDVALHAGISADRVVEIFVAAEYLVYFVGFSTCFPYLGGLPPELATPRLQAPRKHVPAGSVAIGGAQAGVYPLPSPGGWRLIGRTELRLFDPAGEPPAFLRMGDRVRFVERGFHSDFGLRTSDFEKGRP
jgi:KipI family sensor histidine kinase inhibitor